MHDEQFTKWLKKGFEALLEQEWNSGLGIWRCFEELWHKKKIRYNGDTFDSIDELSSRLVCANLFAKGQLLIILSDNSPKRPAALFATALIITTLSSILSGRGRGPVLYFGTTLGIRSQLSHVSVRGLQLADVFSQISCQGSASVARQAIRTLPDVICAYSPLDPIALVKSHLPRWVAIDCGDTLSIQWLYPLLDYLRSEKIPTIGWSSNPLSVVRQDFKNINAYIFKWPTAIVQHSHPDVLDTFLDRSKKTIVPCFINGAATDEISKHFKNALRTLLTGIAKKPGRLGHDALLSGLRYLRSLERVMIPLDLHDAESSRYWGVKAIHHLKNSFEKYTSSASLATTNVSEFLETAKQHLDIIYDTFRNNDPPRWNALIELCLEDVPAGHARILVFPSEAQKLMFAFALLSRVNTSEHDLSAMRIWLMSFKTALSKLNIKSNRTLKNPELGNSNNIPQPSNLYWDVIHVSLPNQVAAKKITPFFNLDKFEILLYPHQCSSFFNQVNRWGDLLGIDFTINANTISALTDIMMPKAIPEKVAVTHIAAVRTIAGKSLPRKLEEAIKPIWEPLPEDEELAFILTDEDGEEDGEIIFDKEEGIEEKETIVDRALEIIFTNGWRGLFALDSKINVVQTTPDGDRVESRYVRSLRKNDRVVYIYGQKRQSLYDLVLSRVHHHPSIEIHLALIRQWQNEIRQAYVEWLQRGKTLYDLFLEMKKQGTQLETDVALRFWLSGCTLRPRDREDMRRVAEILNMPFTLQHYKRISSAGDRIHRLHISLSRRLNLWIQSGATSVKISDDLIDEATGLTFSDIRDSLILLRIESISEVEGLFDKSGLNRIERRTTGG